MISEQVDLALTLLHEANGLGLDGRALLVGLLQVLHDVDVGGKVQHVLLAAAVGHPQQVLQAADGRAHDVT